MNSSPYSLIIKTQAGLEEVLAAEVAASGGRNVQILKRAVKCEAGQEEIYRINYCCRTALRVLREVFEFEAGDENALYDAVKKFDWQAVLDVSRSIAVNATVNNSKMAHSHYVALKTKDAIVDRFREETGKRPDVDLENPDLRIHIHISGIRCTLLFDSSGDSLHKRGYRTRQGVAPINEVLAAGMILLSGWNGETDFLDPMCGSGTLLCEANMIARQIPAGFFRKQYGFMQWKDFDKKLWEQVCARENAKTHELKCKIFGSDVNQNALSLASEIITGAGFETNIELKQVAFENSTAPNPDGGLIIFNPPYGERIQKNDIRAFYKMIGDVLKSKYAGYDAWLITSDFDALKNVGLRTSRKIQLFNGPLECRFVKYEMYRGSRKAEGSKD